MKTPAPTRDAATVVVLRDGARGLELYLVKRARTVDFMAGAHVFPGGRLDPADSSPSTCALLSNEAAALHERLGEALPATHAARSRRARCSPRWWSTWTPGRWCPGCAG